jgi:RNA polymerase sigma-70 factor, ECF subfamily
VKGSVGSTSDAHEQVESPAELTLEALYRAHASTVAQWALRLGGPAVDWQDVVQDVFIKVQRELPRFRGAAQVTTWLYTFTINELRNRRRKDSVRGMIGGSKEESLVVVDRGPSPHESLERAQANRRVAFVLGRLSARARETLVLFEMEGRSGREVSERMGIPLSNVWVTLHRARAAFARELARLEAEGLESSFESTIARRNSHALE